MKCAKLFFLTINTRTQTQKVGADVSSGRGVWDVNYHFPLKAWPSVFPCNGGLWCSRSFGTFTTYEDLRRISGASVVGVDALTACFIAHCTRGVGGGSGWGEGCDRTFLWTHFSR